METKNKNLKMEIWLLYDESRHHNSRPYSYVFPYLECPFAQNAIDVGMRRIWQEEEVKMRKDAQKQNNFNVKL